MGLLRHSAPGRKTEKGADRARESESTEASTQKRRRQWVGESPGVGPACVGPPFCLLPQRHTPGGDQVPAAGWFGKYFISFFSNPNSYPP